MYNSLDPSTQLLKCRLSLAWLSSRDTLTLYSDWLAAAVHHAAGRHAAPEGAAGAAHAHDRGQHPAAAGRAAPDPGGAAEGAGTGPAGECCPLLPRRPRRAAPSVVSGVC